MTCLQKMWRRRHILRNDSTIKYLFLRMSSISFLLKYLQFQKLNKFKRLVTVTDENEREFA